MNHFEEAIMSATKWKKTTRGNPCPVCEKSGWCSVSEDGLVTKCRHQAEGGAAKNDKNGAPYYIHRISDGPRTPSPPRRTPRASSVEKAVPDALHRVYATLLDRLTLSEGDRENLTRRGLHAEAIERGHYRSLESGLGERLAREVQERLPNENLPRVPGFVRAMSRTGKDYLTLKRACGILVPCRDLQGRIVALKVRNPRPADPKKRYFYLSSGDEGPSSGTPIHAPKGMPMMADLVRITEGELKADASFHCTGIPTLSFPGVGNWRPTLAVLAEMQAKTVRLAFDADWCSKPHVAKCLVGMAEALVGEGYSVEMEVWPTEEGNPKGLDDLLAAGGIPEILVGDRLAEALAEAREVAGGDENDSEEDEGSSKSDIKSRVSRAIEQEGPSGLFDDEDLLNDIAALEVRDRAAFASLEALLRKSKLSIRQLHKVLVERRPKPVPIKETQGPTYDIVNGCLCVNRKTQDGMRADPIAMFDARIVAEVVLDDGAEEKRRFALEGTNCNGLPLERIEVPAEEYARMEWVTPLWGQRAIVCPGKGVKDHVRFAIQWRSGEPPRERTYGHLGWREIEGEWVYLHVGGGIGSQGNVAGIRVQLPEELSRFVLPTPPTGEARKEAVRAVLGILRVGLPG